MNGLPKIIMENILSFSFQPSRLKAHGRMWEGQAVADVHGNEIKLQLWHHGGMEETEETLKPHLYLQQVNGLDAYWNAKLLDSGLWLHEEGWFENDALGEVLRKNKSFTDEQMVDLGFVRLFDFNY